jgi:diguanylate cyclase (GGDEF)-like protein
VRTGHDLYAINSPATGNFVCNRVKGRNLRWGRGNFDMMTVLNCIRDNHNLMMVLVAAIVCVLGSLTVLRLFADVVRTSGLQKAGWQFIAAVAAGSSIWCTHFIAMLGYEPGVPVSFDAVLTIVSLLLAICGCWLGFAIAASGFNKAAPAIGGAVVGLSTVCMHYTGMIAYRVAGIISWDMNFLVASIILATVLSALSIHVFMLRQDRSMRLTATGILVLAIVALHFTGMTALRVEPMIVDGSFSDPAALRALGIAIGGVAIIIAGVGLASHLIDGSVREESLERLREMAMNDSLTGLPNRASFNDRLDHEIDLASETGGKLALVCIDLDRFKEINDLRGHVAGDQVLISLAHRMHAELRDNEFISRLGGDEFAAIQRFRSETELSNFLERLEGVIGEPIKLDESEFTPGAMYRAKADILHSVCFYEPSMDQTVRARRALTSDLKAAVENDLLDVYYQVQTSVATGDIRGYEALLRWEHPKHGFISPADFIPLAEESGLILPLGEWVLRTACARAASWSPPYKVSINISPVQFVHADLPTLIKGILEETGLPPERLELELTESTIFADRERSLAMLRQIKDLGVSIALDDFGTGYSSLETLRAFPFDKIKLDRSFMGEAETSPQAKAIIRAVLALGKSLEIPVLAEGIETEGQLSLLGVEGCDEAQGYLLGRPLPLNKIIEGGQITVDGTTGQAKIVFPSMLTASA